MSIWLKSKDYYCDSDVGANVMMMTGWWPILDGRILMLTTFFVMLMQNLKLVSNTKIFNIPHQHRCKLHHETDYYFRNIKSNDHSPFHLTDKMLSIIIASTEHFCWDRRRTWWWIVAWSWIFGLIEPKKYFLLCEATNRFRTVDPWAWCWRKSIFMTSIKLSLIHWLDSCIWKPIKVLDGPPVRDKRTYS